LNGLDQWFSKWAESALGGDFEGQGGEKIKGAIGGKNAQPLPVVDR